ncbi:hypothetical protein QF027_009749 [Streptomyces canus]|nr:hypothetical protein [Streptomyces canus]
MIQTTTLMGGSGVVTSAGADGVRHPPQRHSGRKERGRHGHQAEPGEVAEIGLGVVLVQDAAPQEGGERARGGFLRPVLDRLARGRLGRVLYEPSRFALLVEERA